MTCPTGGAPNINYGKKYLWKNRSICPSPLISQEKSIMEIMATSKNYEKKVRITSGIFWTLVGKNPIMEKSDAGAACLSWTFFFHNSVGDHRFFLGPFNDCSISGGWDYRRLTRKCNSACSLQHWILNEQSKQSSAEDLQWTSLSLSLQVQGAWPDLFLVALRWLACWKHLKPWNEAINVPGMTATESSS